VDAAPSAGTVDVVIDGDTAATTMAYLVPCSDGDRVLVLRLGTSRMVAGVVGGGCPHAVGDLYTTTSATAPGDRWPGTTWEAYAAGRVLVGIDTADAAFDAVGETGGAQTHTLSAAEMPVHTHLLGSTGTAGSDSQSVLRSTEASPKDQVGTQSAGSGQAHNNLQPYVVVYMWKRTA
jgi:hypothetical protein